jgi:hypothetical protein
MYCVALDPGGTTGAAVVESEGEQWTMNVLQLGPEPHHEQLFRKIALWKPEVIICESFINVGMDAAVLTSREYIGVVRLYVQMLVFQGHHCELVFQSSSIAKQFWKDSQLKAFHAYVPGMQHARDAIRHYLYWRTFTLNDKSLLTGERLAKVISL